MTTPTAVIVLAAGAGTRMKSSLPKVVHPVVGRSMIGHALHAAAGTHPDHLVAVVRHQRELVAAEILRNNPDVIIADEPTTALDVTIQAQVLDLLAVAQRETNAAVVLITHDLGVVAGTADDILVMYAGKAVERASVDKIFANPTMPYTMGLLGAVPKPHMPASQRLVPINGNPPSLVAIPAGCPFSPRCPLATEECHQTEPELRLAEEGTGHLVSCHKIEKIHNEHLTYKEVFPAPEDLPAQRTPCSPVCQRPYQDVPHYQRRVFRTGHRQTRRS